MQNFLFDTPWWFLLLLIAGGGAIWWSGNNRQDKTLKCIGWIAALAGVGLGVLSWFVDTPVEAATRHTHQIVRAVEHRDWNTLSSLIDARTNFANAYSNRDDIVNGARRTADAIGLKSVHILGTDSQQKDTVINVYIKVLSDQERTGGQQIVTNWEFDWQNFGNGWRLSRIMPLRGETVGPDQIVAHLERVR